MNNDLQDFIKKTASINAAIAPINSWHKMISNPYMDSLHKSKFPTAALGSVVSQIFKNSAYFDNQSALKEYFDNNITRTVVGNAKLWNSIGAISHNQQSISSILSANTFVQKSFLKRQVATPSFAMAVDPVLWGYNSKLTSLQSALKGISSQIALKGLAVADEDFLDDFNTTTQEAVAITEELTKTEYVTTEAIAKLEDFIGTSFEKLKESIADQIKTKGKSPLELVGIWVGILGILFTIFSMIQTHQAQNQPANTHVATKEDVTGLKEFVSQKFEKALEQTTDEAILRIDCNLRYNPFQKSKGFFKLKSGQRVRIIDTKHRWVRIVIIDPADNLPLMGWIMRKYIVRK